jgi:hypothetical protein
VSAADSVDLLATNRAILVHCDTYSAALVFARWGKTLLLPEALPEAALPVPAPSEVGPAHDADGVTRMVIERYGLNPAEVARVKAFDPWMQTETGPIRIHLFRFTTFLAPAQMVGAHGGVFQPLSELRRLPKVELALVRQGFDLIMGGGGGRG